MTEAVAAALGLEWEPARAPARGVHASRGERIRHPGAPEPGLELPIASTAVLLEAVSARARMRLIGGLRWAPDWHRDVRTTHAGIGRRWLPGTLT